MVKEQNLKETSYQVHELGHNFGFSHSGTETDPYSDPTCYMGYSWTGEKKMCFNAAKTWHTGWYEDYHVRYDARYDETAPALIELVGIDTLVQLIDDKKATDRNLVLKIMLDPDLVDTTLFLMFNRKPETGLNSGVRGDADKLVIVAQKWRGGASTWRASLDPGEFYTEAGVTVKNCAVTLGYPSKVSVLVYQEGDTSAKCTNPGANPTPKPASTALKCDECGDKDTLAVCCYDTWTDMCADAPTVTKKLYQPCPTPKPTSTALKCDDCGDKDTLAVCCYDTWTGMCANAPTVTKKLYQPCPTPKPTSTTRYRGTTREMTNEFSQANQCSLLNRVNTPSTDLSVAVLLASPAWSLPVILTVLCLG